MSLPGILYTDDSAIIPQSPEQDYGRDHDRVHGVSFKHVGGQDSVLVFLNEGDTSCRMLQPHSESR